MTTALYRRYRPESFGEMIGQSQVTEPLMTALRGDRVGHAYLFSGPRGCGKTTSARILARCLNCAEGPTDVPCGTCPSCVELSRAGGGSLDVVEIDAASHNGVDDARDLRERATFAPSRDRYKIFILDEAHMVTPQGFNALLKLVEEPPEHVKFIFATTEPEKVLGTIRSRTHHYPFRLVPPAAMLEYVEKLCIEEGVIVEQGVLPLVVRAGGGSPRDTLSLLDQLIAGSDSPAGSETVTVGYERAVALLGYTHGALLDEIVDALAAADAAAAFPAIDRVVQTGQDPRRFVDDLLERLRDLIVIAAVGSGASAVLRGIAVDDLERMRVQADAFGAARLSRTADIVSAALDDMSGATSPRLHLELLVARVLAGGADAAAAAPVATAERSSAHTSVVERGSAASETKRSKVPVTSAPAASAVVTSAEAPSAAAAETAPAETAPAASAPAASAPAASAPAASAPAASAPAAPAPSGPVTFDRVSASWPAVLKRLETISRMSWLLATAVQPLGYDTDTEVLTLGFTSQHDVAKFKGTTPGSGPSDHLRSAIEQELGVRVKYLPAPMPTGGAPRQPSASGAARPADAAPASEPASAGSPRPQVRSASAAPVTDWAVAPIPAASEASAPQGLGAASGIAASPAAAAGPESSAPESSAPATAAPATAPAAGISAPTASAPTAPEPASSRSPGRALADDEPPLPDEPPAYDDEPPYDPMYEPAMSDAPAQPKAPVQNPAPSAASAAPSARPPRAAPVVTDRTPAGGVQRYGEAVIRQVLGATFVREEPYEPPTRFS
ncbi:DNA polymerase III subunit gamma and tau [Microbacterium sp. SD291]|uniref:DNA polymerase III subunit gamma and tau n=1 Tax=Microbacterium sp. SD291 TaxID=2782007 RepID=UPI001A96230E|nr:DNA polymerase III subunit gamma and tau [Microbacterium sp. SD291]MBO0979921.1 DNA polymerase III subunit gamma and tau [Microbacterium sp. SD291]